MRQMFQSILCPVDFSDHSIEALRFAIGLAGRDQAQLTVLTVNAACPPNRDKSGFGAPHLERELEKGLRSLLLRLIPGTADWAPVPRLKVRAGNPHVAILDCASEERCDLIVIGTHGFGSRRQFVVGSVTDRILRHSAVPVLVVPLLAPRVVVFTDGAPVFHIGHVLAPVDFGSSTNHHVNVAGSVAESFGASLVLVHVLRLVEMPNVLRAALHRDNEERRDRALKQLASLASSNRAVVVQTHVAAGKTAPEIARIAAEHAAGLIVIGLSTKGGGQSRLSSMATRVLTTLAVPVLALPPADEESERSARVVTVASKEVPNGRTFWRPGA